VNDIALADVSGEVVTNIYWHLKKASLLANTILISIVNDRIGYVPDNATYDRPIFAVNGSPMARGCVENGIVSGIVEDRSHSVGYPEGSRLGAAASRDSPGVDETAIARGGRPQRCEDTTWSTADIASRLHAREA
jgi:hypothetical protein